MFSPPPPKPFCSLGSTDKYCARYVWPKNLSIIAGYIFLRRLRVTTIIGSISIMGKLYLQHFFPGEISEKCHGPNKKIICTNRPILANPNFLSRRRRGRMPYKGRRIRTPPFTTRGQGTTNRRGPSLLASHLMAAVAPDGEKGKSFLAPLQASLFPKARWGGRRVDVDRNRSLPAFPLPPPTGSSSTVGYTRRRCVGEEGNLL